jgi:transposase
VAGVDEWSWRKGAKFGTIVVDLERRRVVDLLADRTAARMADWFKQHPEVGIINRDRDGLYADAALQGAPQARQVADRFHLLKNLRETIARQLGGVRALGSGADWKIVSDDRNLSQHRSAAKPVP